MSDRWADICAEFSANVVRLEPRVACITFADVGGDLRATVEIAQVWRESSVTMTGELVANTSARHAGWVLVQQVLQQLPEPEIVVVPPWATRAIECPRLLGVPRAEARGRVLKYIASNVPPNTAGMWRVYWGDILWWTYDDVYGLRDHSGSREYLPEELK